MSELKLLDTIHFELYNSYDRDKIDVFDRNTLNLL